MEEIAIEDEVEEEEKKKGREGGRVKLTVGDGGQWNFFFVFYPR